VLRSGNCSFALLRAKEVIVNHRYAVGQMLELRSAPLRSNRQSGTCEVIACLPTDAGPALYRVKSLSENYERVVEEIELSPSGSVKDEAFEVSESFFNIAIKKR
jgi:hypothetical protein